MNHVAVPEHIALDWSVVTDDRQGSVNTVACASNSTSHSSTIIYPSDFTTITVGDPLNYFFQVRRANLGDQQAIYLTRRDRDNIDVLRGNSGIWRCVFTTANGLNRTVEFGLYYRGDGKFINLVIE